MKFQKFKKPIAFLKKANYRLALATNSPYNIIPVVLKKIGLEDTFNVIVSAESELEEKPNTAVYLTASQKLSIEPENCFVIEDSVTGMQAGKAAGMNVIVFTNENINTNLPLFDHKIDSFKNLDLSIFK